MYALYLAASRHGYEQLKWVWRGVLGIFVLLNKTKQKKKNNRAQSDSSQGEYFKTNNNKIKD